MPGFASTAWQVVGQVCRAAGWPAGDAELIRVGNTGVFGLRSRGVVVRVARPGGRWPAVARELCVARWLDSAGIPVAAPYDELRLRQPWLVEGCPVSVWHLVESGVPPPDLADLGGLLRRLHGLADVRCRVPALDPVAVAARRVASPVPGLDEDDRVWLRDRCDRLRARYAQLQPVLRPGIVHGDARTGNLTGRRGAAVLLDLESAAVGLREWDLVGPLVALRRFGASGAEYQQFVAAYGVDVRTWPGAAVLRDIREVRMTTWLAHLDQTPDVAAEVAARIRSLRDTATTTRWQPF